MAVKVIHTHHPKFSRLIEARRQRQECCCWSHLRMAGITPPRALRANYPDRYPHKVFDRDAQGEPWSSKKEEE